MKVATINEKYNTMKYTKTYRKKCSRERNGEEDGPLSAFAVRKRRLTIADLPELRKKRRRREFHREMERKISYTYDVFVEDPNPKLRGLYVRRRLLEINYSQGGLSDNDPNPFNFENGSFKRLDRRSVLGQFQYAAPLRYFRIQNGDTKEAVARAEAFVRDFVGAGQEAF